MTGVQSPVDAVCPLCGSTRGKAWKPGLRKCFSCRVAFRLNRVPNDQLVEYWEDEYWSEAIIQWHKRRRSSFENAERVLEKYVPTKGAVLDIGCGVGEFLAICAERGWQATGVEPSAAASTIARMHSGIEVVNSFFPSDLLTNTICREKMDAIFVSNTIDQVPDPLKLLTEADKILRDQGVLMIRTPNLIFQEILCLHRNRSNPQWGISTQSKDQLYVFHPDTLKMLLGKVGVYKLAFLNARPFAETQHQPIINVSCSTGMFHVANLVWLLTCRKVVVTPSMLVVAVKGAR